MKKIISFLLIVFSLNCFGLDGDRENEIQEKALIIVEDNGIDSPEIDEFLQENDLKESDLIDLE